MLKPGGLPTIVQYVRDGAGSRRQGLGRFPDRMGRALGLRPPRLAAELERLAGFGELEYVGERAPLALTPVQFVGLMQSSSHGRPAIEKLGKARAEEMAHLLADSLKGADGNIDYGYIFQAFTLRRAG